MHKSVITGYTLVYCGMDKFFKKEGLLWDIHSLLLVVVVGWEDVVLVFCAGQSGLAMDIHEGYWRFTKRNEYPH